MEQPCYKCGQAVEQGVPFCPHCAAPQIRVVLAGLPASSGLADDQGAATADVAISPVVEDSLPLTLRGGGTLKPCVLAALVGTVLSVLGLYVFVAMPGVGFLAVLFYRQHSQGDVIKAGLGAKLGALSGVLFSSMIGVLSLLASVVPEVREKAREQFLENAQKWAATRPSDPQVQAALDLLKTPQGLVTALIFGSVLFLVLAVVLSIVGGAVAGSIFGRRDKS